MKHIVLLGDSIFDNAAYVPGGEPVVAQLQSRLPNGDRVSLLARDGSIIATLTKQFAKIPDDCSHLVVSIGGNNALENSDILRSVDAAQQAFAELATIQQGFAKEYRQMLRTVIGFRRPTVICTIYDAIPGLKPQEVTALSIFNDAIIRAGIEVGVPILDLRLVCNEVADFSTVSPIEPSERGGSKIVRAILRVINGHDFTRSDSVIYR